MKASELINFLQAAIYKYGDMDIRSDYGGKGGYRLSRAKLILDDPDIYWDCGGFRDGDRPFVSMEDEEEYTKMKEEFIDFLKQQERKAPEWVQLFKSRPGTSESIFDLWKEFEELAKEKMKRQTNNSAI